MTQRDRSYSPDRRIGKRAEQKRRWDRENREKTLARRRRNYARGRADGLSPEDARAHR